LPFIAGAVIFWRKTGVAIVPDTRIRVVLIGSEIEENLAIRYLASSLDAHGHDVTIVPCS